MSGSVELRGVGKQFGDFVALRDVDFEIRAGGIHDVSRTVGLREDDLFATHQRLRHTDFGPSPHRGRRRRSAPCASPPIASSEARARQGGLLRRLQLPVWTTTSSAPTPTPSGVADRLPSPSERDRTDLRRKPLRLRERLGSIAATIPCAIANRICSGS